MYIEVLLRKLINRNTGGTLDLHTYIQKTNSLIILLYSLVRFEGRI